MASLPRIRLVRFGLAAVGASALSGTASAQFVDNTSDIPSGSPANNSASENVDFADVDDDGDWDAAFADGGDNSIDQNRIWINQGGLQGGTTGVFVDETNTRFPAITDQSRDIEFVDFDGDEDVDIYVSNTSTILPETNRWWRNTGTHSGNYVDETSTRWVGLASANSSIPTADLLAVGFLDFSCDCDFGDLDNDGDMDLFHSTYGGQFNGNVPSRIFLNDGAGFFEEFNPSGYKLPNRNIQNGEPGLWCEGTQQANTTNTDGTNCDVAATALDIDLGDLDGDFDLDVLHGARSELPRMFQNRLEENGGVLGFRDVTGTFPAGYSAGTGHYEQELGDLDGDGDLDIYGLNWAASIGTSDNTLENGGSADFTISQVLSNSSDDDNEGDFLDYDLDGDLDLFVASFLGSDRLYRNDNNGGGSGFSYTEVSFLLPGAFAIALDADVCDVDSDGDTDVWVSNDGGTRNFYYENTLRDDGVGPQDTHAPYIPNVEQAPDRTVGSEPTVVRAQVYDNTSYYITWYNETWLEVQVDGGSPQVFPMKSSGGQIFRGEIPGSLSGNVTYRVFSEDEYGNQGSSAILSYDASGGSPGTPFCFGDTGCQCGNTSAAGSGEGCLNSQGHGAILSSSGSASIAADDLVFSVSQGRPTQPTLFVQGSSQISAPFKDGRLCTGSPTERMGVAFLDASGAADSSAFSIVMEGNVTSPGSTRWYQAWYRDPNLSPCGEGSNFTSGIELTWQP